MPSTRPAVLLFLLGVLTLLLSSILVLWPAWDGKANAHNGEARKTPNYEVLTVRDAAGIRQMAVSTTAAKESGMRLVVEKLREDNTPEDGALLIEFTDPEASRDTGFALVYDSKRAVMEAGETERFGEVYDEDAAKRIMREEDGVRVVGYKEFAQDNPRLSDEVRRFLR